MTEHCEHFGLFRLMRDASMLRHAMRHDIQKIEHQIKERNKVDKALLNGILDNAKALADVTGKIDAGIPGAITNATAAQDAVENPIGQQIGESLTAALNSANHALGLLNPATSGQ